MPCNDYLYLKGVDSYNYNSFANCLQQGLIDFYTWGFVNIGAFINISRGMSGVYGGDRSRLRRVSDPRFTAGTVYEGFKSNWVWETGLIYNVQPQRISGVYINGVFKGTGDAIYGHYVDYVRGRVVFSSGMNSSTVVQCEFSPRLVTFVRGDSDIVRRLNYDCFDVSREDFLTYSSGNWNELADTRVQLPVVGVQLETPSHYKPAMLGGTQFEVQDIVFYIFSDNPIEANQIQSIIQSQNDRSIFIPNYGVLISGGTYPYDLDYLGRLVSNPLQYDTIINNYWGWKTRISDMKLQENKAVNEWLHRRVVRMTTETLRTNI
jgi:hypothetical protein